MSLLRTSSLRLKRRSTASLLDVGFDGQESPPQSPKTPSPRFNLGPFTSHGRGIGGNAEAGVSTVSLPLGVYSGSSGTPKWKSPVLLSGLLKKLAGKGRGKSGSTAGGYSDESENIARSDYGRGDRSTGGSSSHPTSPFASVCPDDPPRLELPESPRLELFLTPPGSGPLLSLTPELDSGGNGDISTFETSVEDVSVMRIIEEYGEGLWGTEDILIDESKEALPEARKDRNRPPQPGFATSQEKPLLSAEVTRSKSLTPVQVLRSYGYIGAGMVRDESIPFDSSESAGSIPDISECPPFPPRASKQKVEVQKATDMESFLPSLATMLCNEQAPFSMTSPDSVYPLPVRYNKRREGLSLGLGLDLYAAAIPVVAVHGTVGDTPSDLLSPLPSAKGKGLWGVEEDDLTLLVSLKWPLPPKRTIIVVRDKAEVWIDPVIEFFPPAASTLVTPQRDVLCFPDAGSASPVARADLTFEARMRKHRVRLADAQVEGLASRANILLRRGSLDVPTPDSSKTEGSLPSPHYALPSPSYFDEADEVLSDNCETPRPLHSVIKTMDYLIEANDLDKTIEPVIYLTSTHSPGQHNQITVTSPSWRQLTKFCERHARTVIQAVPKDVGKQLEVIVRDYDLEDGTEVMATMRLEGAKKPMGPRKMVARFMLELPVSMKEIGMRCKESGVGEGMATSRRGGSRLPRMKTHSRGL
ncbi:hypothetical protein FRB99_007859 [Tulasnella sp. 403]|nr:hypothetical protein FRB99_007859 [Tulasnella sp. 403]